jgi:hypothetical protein
VDAAVNVAVDYVHGAVLPAAGRPRRSDHAPVSLGSELDRHGDERFPAQRWLLAQLREGERARGVQFVSSGGAGVPALTIALSISAAQVAEAAVTRRAAWPLWLDWPGL